ncbi:MAG: LamG-like jellyroll fold domain-containing protein [Thermoguttaceae bacterium]
MRSILATVLFVFATGVVSAAGVDDVVLDTPILFAKQYNYQGLHIYDTFYQWRPGGGIYVLENPAAPPEEQRVRAVIDPTTPTTLGDGIYFDPALSFDATKLLFCYKGSQTGNSTIYEIGIDGTGLRQLTNLDDAGNPYLGSGSGHHDVRPNYLPDGRIVFTSTRYSGLVPCANNGVAILHIMDSGGRNIHTISVNNVTEFDPAVLPGGQILFGRWEYIDKNALTIQSLWTVLPDGTNETALYANNMVFPESIMQAKPVLGSDHLIVGTFAPHNAPPRGTIAMIDTHLGKNDPAAIINFETPDRPTFDRGESCDPWAITEDVVLYSGIPTEDSPKIGNDTPAGARSNPKLNAMMLIDRTGKRRVVYSDPKFDIHTPTPIAPRETPPLLADTTDRTKTTGSFFVSDVYEGNPGVERGSVKWLRVVEETSRVSESPGGTWMNQTFSISAALAWSPKIYHGIVPVEEDGSVFFEAPSGRSLYFQLLDKDYRLVRSMRTFIQAAPGTTRSCTGCHEYKPISAAGQQRLVAREPQQLRDESWGSGYFDYPSMVQPILDRRCVSCHGGEEMTTGGIDLSGGWTELFSISYENLTARREKQYTADLISGVCCMNGTAHWSCKIFGPYEHGSGNAPLAAILMREPHRSAAKLTDTERETLFTWIDSNGIYYGSWDYTATGAFAREYPAAKGKLIAVMNEAGCAKCHAGDDGVIKRFDDWINLERPEMSRILRAPLAASNSADGGFGLELCRDRKVPQNFSRLGLMFQSGYEHAVRDLDKFATQKWLTLDERKAGEPVTPFASTSDATYQKMLQIIEEARSRQLGNPRVDMPFANEIGRGIVAGRSRQILPQPLPETMPPLTASVDDDGVVRLRWERSARTIGLVTEVHRFLGTSATAHAQSRHARVLGGHPENTAQADAIASFAQANPTALALGPRRVRGGDDQERSQSFVPNESTLLATTELFQFTDLDAPRGEVAYAIVFVSDPAATCGTCKIDPASMSATPTVQSIEDRCPLTRTEPIRSEPSFAEVNVPQPREPIRVTNVAATPDFGCVYLRWSDDEQPLARYDILRSSGSGAATKLNSEPLATTFFTDTTPEDGVAYGYTVVRLGRGGASPPSEPVVATVKPEPREPVFDLGDLNLFPNLTDGASWNGAVLNFAPGGAATFPAKSDYQVSPRFAVKFTAKLTQAGEMPVLVSFGSWNRAGWFVQRIGSGFRFHYGGIDCDGGTFRVGEPTDIVATYDGTTCRLYQDGKLVAERAGAAKLAPWDGSLVIGQYSGGVAPPYQCIGEISGVQIYRTPRP